MQLRADARANRERIVAAARATFAEKGLEAEVREIAERAGVAVGTLYRHFPSKDDLLTAIARDALTVAVAEARAAESMEDPIAGLRALLVQEFAEIVRYGWLAEALFTGRLPTASWAEILAAAEDARYAERFERLIRRAVDRGRLRPDLDIAAAAALLAGVGAPWNRRRLPAERTAEQAADAVMAVFLHGAT